MQTSHNSSVSYSFLFWSIVLLSWALLTSPQPPSQPPSVACMSTPYPKLCRTILSAFNSSPSDDPYSYGKFTVEQCLKQARRLSSVIDRYVRRVQENPPAGVSSSRRREEVGAVEDCGELAELSVDYLEEITEELKAAETMTEDLMERVTSLLSAVVTNQQTCIDGLVEAKSPFAAAIGLPVANLTPMYSVALGLVVHWQKRNLTRTKVTPQNKLFGNHSAFREPLETLIKVLRSSCNETMSCLSEILAKQNKTRGVLIRDMVLVGPYRNDNFTRIADAVAAAPNKTKPVDGYFVIYVREGLYEEYVIVARHKRNVMLIGDGINKTIISGNHSAADGWRTFNSSTFAVLGERFVAVDVTFQNTAGPQKHQAVAVKNQAELSTFYRCSFEGYQDTLYVHSNTQFYRDCDVYGTVDFICGNAAAVFQNCNLYARKPMANQKNTFTAQARQNCSGPRTGISIHNCTVQAAPDLAADPNSTLTYLGRPWKPYSNTVYMQSYISDVVHPAGWLEWNDTAGLDTVFYGEYENYGPGANTSKRVKSPGCRVMNATEAMYFTVYNFTTGDTWLPATDIPFVEGLVNTTGDSYSGSEFPPPL